MGGEKTRGDESVINWLVCHQDSRFKILHTLDTVLTVCEILDYIKAIGVECWLLMFGFFGVEWSVKVLHSIVCQFCHRLCLCH